MKLSPFNTPRWQHRNPATRREALEMLAGEELAEATAHLLQNDKDAGVRAAAAKRCDDLTLLAQVAKQDVDPDVCTAATQRRIDWLGGRTEQPTASESRLQKTQQETDVATLEGLAQQAVEPEIRLTALSKISRQGLLGDIALRDQDRAVQLAAVHAIDQHSTLERVVEEARTQAKEVSEAAATRLDQLLLASGDLETVARHQRELCRKLDALVQTQAEEQQVEALQSAWNELPAGDPALQTRFDNALALHAKLRAQPVPEPIPAVEEVPDETPDADTPSPAAKLMKAVARRMDSPKLLQEAQIKTFLKRWDDGEADPELEGEFRKRIDALRERWRNQRQQTGDAVQQAGALLDQLDKHIVAGELTQARKLQPQIAEALSAAAAMKAPEAIGLRARHERIREHAAELDDWAHWGHNRERRRICDELEALAEAGDTHPEKLAKLIRQAKQAWQKLDDKERVPGTDAPPAGEGLERRFKSACHRAYQPCIPHFEKLAKNREGRLEEVLEVVTRLEQAGADNAVPPQQCAALIREGRETMRKLGNVPRKHQDKTAKRIKAAIAPLEERIAEGHRVNANAKRRFIDNAERDLKTGELKDRIDLAKRLQRDWKTIGPADRKEEQALWKEFRTLLDGVFGELDDKRKAERAEQKSHRDQLTQLCKQIEELASEDQADALANDLKRLCSQWDNAFGARDDRKLEKRFRAGEKAVREKLKTQRQAKNAARIETLANYAKLCEQREAGADLDGLQAEWDALEPLDERLMAALNKRLHNGVQSGDDNVVKAREICVRLELATDSDSPPDASQERMTYQINALNNRLQAGENIATRPAAILEEWYLLGPLPADVRADLQKRIDRAAPKR